MTLEEFEKWVSENRRKLIRVAWKAVGKLDAEDAVQNAVVSILANKTYLKATHQRNLVAFFSRVVTSRARHARRGRAREEVFKAGLTHLLGAGRLRGGSNRKPSMDQQEGRS